MLSLRLVVLSVGIGAVQSAAIRSNGVSSSLYAGHPSLQEDVSKSKPTSTMHYMIAANAMTEISKSQLHIHRLVAMQHSENASNYKELYEQKEEDLAAQKELCAKCEGAEESLILVLKKAKDAHTDAQRSLEELERVKQLLKDSEGKIKSLSDEYGALKKQTQAALVDLAITSQTDEYGAIKAKIDQLLELAKKIVQEQGTAEKVAEAVKVANDAYENFKNEANEYDKKVTLKMTSRDEACAGITLPN